MFEIIWALGQLLLGMIFVLIVADLFLKSMGWSPVVFHALGEMRKDETKDEMTRTIASVLWVLAGAWYAISVLIVFFTGMWLIAGLLADIRNWWHSPK